MELEAVLVPTSEKDFTVSLTANVVATLTLPLGFTPLSIQFASDVDVWEGQNVPTANNITRNATIMYNVPVRGRKVWYFLSTSNGTVKGKILGV